LAGEAVGRLRTGPPVVACIEDMPLRRFVLWNGDEISETRKIHFLKDTKRIFIYKFTSFLILSIKTKHFWVTKIELAFKNSLA